MFEVFFSGLTDIPDVDVSLVVHVKGVGVGVQVPVQDQLLNNLLPTVQYSAV